MLNIPDALEIARKEALKTLTDEIVLERLDGQQRGAHGQLTEVWVQAYSGSGLVQTTRTAARDVAGQRPVTVTGHVAKIPYKITLDPQKRYRLTVTNSLDAGNVGKQFEVIGDETNGWAILRRLTVERA